jgi:hypothetical protein
LVQLADPGLGDLVAGQSAPEVGGYGSDRSGGAPIGERDHDHPISVSPRIGDPDPEAQRFVVRVGAQDDEYLAAARSGGQRRGRHPKR